MEFLLKFPGLRDGRPGSPRRAWLNRSLRPVLCTTLTIGDATPSSPQGLARKLRRSAPRRNLLTYREFIAWRKGDTHAWRTSVADRPSHSDHHPALSVQRSLRGGGLIRAEQMRLRPGVSVVHYLTVVARDLRGHATKRARPPGPPFGDSDF